MSPAMRPMRTGAPRVSLLGLATIAAGVALDVGVHSAFAPDHSPADFAPSQHAAHLVVLAGMVLTLAGVVIDGASRQLQRARAPRNEKRSATHAAR